MTRTTRRVLRSASARRVGAGGILLFSYDSLGPEYLSQVGRTLFVQ